ncbi:MAG: DsbA family protein [Thermodesulfobacteriota bacterium]
MPMAALRLFRLLVLLLTVCAAATAHAGVDWEIIANYKTPTTPLDVTASIDGKWTFVLSEGGKLSIFSETGTLEETLNVDPGMDRIASSGLSAIGVPDRLYLTSSKTKAVQAINVEFAAAIDTQGAPFLGTDNAPVTIVLFSDFECPFCGKVTPLLEDALNKYPGKVKVVFKQFPLPMHKQAQPAALAALAAHQQGKFWQYHDLLFENQKNLSEAKFGELAKQVGLDAGRFERDRKAPLLMQILDRDINDGRQAGVRGTPTIFVNGRLLKDRNSEKLHRLVDQELAKRTK